ncbi:hypothetical protein GLOIN_2v1684954 [Rhizophagus irregularis DAOM 181602=DAOM 197198]|uniref:Uncharacterized protein n=1 Tax=Rhizophagus irregularis (strain DAOM 181602 / DAOM 197198 / MUCL 43194) TaxID=747089 RepID=A0A2P4PDY9_RHIID|nr:hypothetical protein GLOIN_2v1684954 [Rhizophagus irregularis DAOM 181602=DAOM 197198]POG63590.1 hypothetical protein GLOIN_2v1684954 [Rhizophagus irregularis DAOM 181602=DAOM 197198]|eukprot:XP_025170456.1 hypothetical protein GLOIN_2v1684954 [Rhizophagus irregularis DAOM 181602=DAOM 197198]
MSSETSTPYTPASTSTTVAGNETVSLADEIKKYDTAKLIDFLRGEKDLLLNDAHFEILRKREIVGRAFLNMDKQDFRDSGFEIGTAIVLADFAKECKEKKKRAFSSYRSLEEVLEKYGIKSSSITSIPQFTPEIKLCIDDILRRIKNMGPVVDRLVILPQMNVSGEESSGRVDYAIKKILDDLLEEIICITEGKQNQPGKGVAQNLMQCRSSCEMNLDTLKKKRTADEAFEEYEYVYGIVTTATDWYFILHSTEAIYCTSKTEYRISLTEDALKDSTDLRKNVKRILGVIVGLLRDRVSASEEPANKKRRVEEIIKKK